MLKSIDVPVVTNDYRTSHTFRRVTPDEVMKFIAGKFQNLKQYEKFVLENNLQDIGFPLNPKYRSGYPKSTDAILGNPEGTYKEWQKNNLAERKPWQHGGRRGRKKKVVQTVKPVATVAPVTTVAPKVARPTKAISDDNVLLEVIKVLATKYYVPMEYLFLIKDTSNIDKSDAVEITDYLIETMSNKIKGKIKL